MVLFNYSTREITAKVVYYGPGLCGKTTNLQFIHSKLDEKARGKMISLATESDRTLFFDFLPINLGTVRGMKVRFQLYTVPGQVFYNATRKLVLRGVDAVVFVADSQAEMLEANRESYQNLKDNLRENGFDPESIPVVMQWNKRDLPNVLPVDVLNKELNERSGPWFEAEAVNGKGVLRTLQGIGKVLMADLMKRYDIKKGQTADGGSTSSQAEAMTAPSDASLPAAAPEATELPEVQAPAPEPAPAPARQAPAPQQQAPEPVAASSSTGSADVNGLVGRLQQPLQQMNSSISKVTQDLNQVTRMLSEMRSLQDQMAGRVEQLNRVQIELQNQMNRQREMLEKAVNHSDLEMMVEKVDSRTDEILKLSKSRSPMPAVKSGFLARRIFDV